MRKLCLTCARDRGGSEESRRCAPNLRSVSGAVNADHYPSANGCHPFAFGMGWVQCHPVQSQAQSPAHFPRSPTSLFLNQSVHAVRGNMGPSWAPGKCGTARRKECAFLCGNFVRKNGTPALFCVAAAGVQPGPSRVQAGAKPVEVRAWSWAHPVQGQVAGRGN